MSCSKILEMFHDDSQPASVFKQALIWLHNIICLDCAQKIKRYETTKNIFINDFFPSSPSFENAIMAKIEAEEFQQTAKEVPGGLSIKGWAIAGLIILISLVTAYWSFYFEYLTNEAGNSFLLPVGITIGIVITAYGAFFIGTHLKELTERFGL